MIALLAGLLAALSVAVAANGISKSSLGPAAARTRARAVGGAARQLRGAGESRAPDRAASRAVPAAAAAGVAAALFIGGLPGVVAGLAVSACCVVIVSRLEPRSVRERRQRLVADAPGLADLLAACLAAGAGLDATVDAAAKAAGGPAGSALEDAASLMRLGADPAVVWDDVGRQCPELAILTRAITRSQRTGAPLADVLLRTADDLRDVHRRDVEAAARSVGVRAVAPLGLCFLPAFLLLGVVPLVAGLVERVLP